MWAILATFGNICYAKIATKRVGVLSSWKCNKRVTMTNKVRIAHISASSYNTYCILCILQVYNTDNPCLHILQAGFLFGIFCYNLMILC